MKIDAREGQHSESTTCALRYVAPAARIRCACGIVASSSREKSSISTMTMLGRSSLAAALAAASDWAGRPAGTAFAERAEAAVAR